MSAALSARHRYRSILKPKAAISTRSLAGLRRLPYDPGRIVFGMSVLSLLLVSPSTPAAQHPDHAMTLPVAISGAETPELISDQLAYRHFILAVAVPQDASNEAISHRDRQLQRTGLSSADRSAFVRALQGLAEQLAANSEEVKRLSSQPAGAFERLAGLRAQRLALLDIARSEVAMSLSEPGRTKLDSYIRAHVKRRIVIYGEAPNESAVSSSRR